jgi:DNA polymerase
MLADPGMEAKLQGPTDLAGFRSEARQLLAHQVPPHEVQWQLQLPVEPYTDLQSPQASRPRNVARAATAIVPASFTRLCEFVVLHRDRERFSLLYRLLWRLVHEPNLRNEPLAWCTSPTCATNRSTATCCRRSTWHTRCGATSTR